MNWAGVLGFETSAWELVLRGTLMYWFIYLLFRFVLRRDVGSFAIAAGADRRRLAERDGGRLHHSA
jgi:hypothetical protein